MIKYLKISALILLAGAVIIVSLIILWFARQHFQNPMAVISRNDYSLKLIGEEQHEIALENETRIYRDVKFKQFNSDSFKATISFPVARQMEKLPVIIILGGLDIGRESLKYIDQPGRNVLIAYEYPYSPRYWYDGTALNQIPVIRKAVLMVPSQVIALAEWTVEQNWCDSDRICLLGYSFGAMFVPAVYHLAAEKNLKIGPGIIAYGGADIYQILKNNLKFLSPFSRFVVARFAASAIYAVEPAVHLPLLKNEFLIINGKHDHQIPPDCWKQLQQLMPHPKTIINLDEGHMNPAKPDLTKKIVRISRNWLRERNLINP